MMLRRVLLTMLVLVAAFTVPLPWTGGAPVAAAVDTEAAEAAFVAHINALRSERGLGELAAHTELTAVARRWATEMAAADRIWHNPDLASAVSAPWLKLGENVGVGMTVERLHDAFIASPSHLRNLVDADFATIGVGVVVGRDGALFTAHVFMKVAEAPAPAPTPVAQAPVAPPEAPRAAVVTPPPPARVVLVLEQLRALDG